MLRIPSVELPQEYPHPEAINSFKDNKHSYEPEFWELQYHISRYLEGVSELALMERYQEIIRNMHTLISKERNIIPIQSFLSSWYWFRKEHQTRLEFFLREIEVPCTIPNNSDFQNKDEMKPVRAKYPNAGDVLFRYGEIDHITDAFKKGRFLIRPASQFDALKEDSARNDDETSKYSYMAGNSTKITTQDGVKIPVIGDIKRTNSMPDYYMLCVSSDWDDKMFSDFKADACLVIKDVDLFSHKLEKASLELFPKWFYHHNPIDYFDPYEKVKNERIDAGMSKDFKFAYQREYRFIWAPPPEENPDEIKFLEIGNLEDISVIYTANEIKNHAKL